MHSVSCEKQPEKQEITYMRFDSILKLRISNKIYQRLKMKIFKQSIQGKACSNHLQCFCGKMSL